MRSPLCKRVFKSETVTNDNLTPIFPSRSLENLNIIKLTFRFLCGFVAFFNIHFPHKSPCLASNSINFLSSELRKYLLDKVHNGAIKVRLSPSPVNLSI